jgi:rfaE bifunctional protein kinase chain/domain
MSNLMALFQNRRVLVIGDTMIDRYLYGTVDRISPEAPVPVLRRTEKEDRPGGAANVALNAAELGMEVAVCSIHGNDKDGESLKEICYAAGIRHQFWTSSEHRPTTIKTRVIARQQHLLRVDFESTENLRTAEFDAFSQRMEDAFVRFQPQIVILQDYNKGLFTPASIERALQLSKTAGCFIAVDPKKDNFSAFRDVDLFKPNLKEFRQATHWERNFDENEISAIADDFIP